MFALRYAGLVALAVWVGGLIAVGGIGAPAIFDVVDARHVTDGRLLSGAIVGELLRRFQLVSYACGAVVIASLATRAVLGPRPRRFAWRLALATLMVGASLYSGLVVAGRVARMQQEIGAAPSSLPDGDPRRAAFGRLHGQSTALQFVPLLGGLALILLELTD